MTSPGLDTGVARAWPSARGRRSSIAAQFGEDRAELLCWALTTADPLADAVVEEIHERGRAGLTWRKVSPRAWSR
jgi:hypothetical protein